MGTKTFKRSVQKQVVVEEEIIEKSYDFPLYLKSGNSNCSYAKITQDLTWDGASDRFDVILVDMYYNVIESVTFDCCFCYNFIEYVDDFDKISSKEEFESVVAKVKEKL